MASSPSRKALRALKEVFGDEYLNPNLQCVAFWHLFVEFFLEPLLSPSKDKSEDNQSNDKLSLSSFASRILNEKECPELASVMEYAYNQWYLQLFGPNKLKLCVKESAIVKGQLGLFYSSTRARNATEKQIISQLSGKCIPISEEQFQALAKIQYPFLYHQKKSGYIVIGLLSLVNHSCTSDVSLAMSKDTDDTLVLSYHREKYTLKEGDEIYANYGEKPSPCLCKKCVTASQLSHISKTYTKRKAQSEDALPKKRGRNSGKKDKDNGINAASTVTSLFDDDDDDDDENSKGVSPAIELDQELFPPPINILFSCVSADCWKRIFCDDCIAAKKLRCIECKELWRALLDKDNNPPATVDLRCREHFSTKCSSCRSLLNLSHENVLTCQECKKNKICNACSLESKCQDESPVCELKNGGLCNSCWDKKLPYQGHTCDSCQRLPICGCCNKRKEQLETLVCDATTKQKNCCGDCWTTDLKCANPECKQKRLIVCKRCCSQVPDVKAYYCSQCSYWCSVCNVRFDSGVCFTTNFDDLTKYVCLECVKLPHRGRILVAKQ